MCRSCRRRRNSRSWRAPSAAAASACAPRSTAALASTRRSNRAQCVVSAILLLGHAVHGRLPNRTTDVRRRTADKDYSDPSLCRPSTVVCRSVAELLAQDALVEAVAGIEQHVHRRCDGPCGSRRRAPSAPRRGRRRRRPGACSASSTSMVTLGAVGQQRAAPAPRPERADRRQRQQRRVDRNDRPLRREIVGGRAGRRRHQHAVGHQLGQALLAVDRDRAAAPPGRSGGTATPR